MTAADHLAEAERRLDEADALMRVYDHADQRVRPRVAVLDLTSQAWSSIFRALVCAVVSITSSLDAQDRVMQKNAVQERADIAAARIWNIETALGLWRKK